MDMKINEARTHQPQSVVSLAADDTIELPDPVGYRIACLSGTVWVSCSERRMQMQIRRGESVTVQCAGKTTLHSREPAQVQVTEDPSVRLGLGRVPSPCIQLNHRTS
jgi:hypothetical protein